MESMTKGISHLGGETRVLIVIEQFAAILHLQRINTIHSVSDSGDLALHPVSRVHRGWDWDWPNR